jgi:hypothetical protein
VRQPQQHVGAGGDVQRGSGGGGGHGLRGAGGGRDRPGRLARCPRVS